MVGRQAHYLKMAVRLRLLQIMPAKRTRKPRTKNFFDRKAVQVLLNKWERKNLPAIGAAIRREELDRVKERKGYSKPGNPPNSHMKEIRRKINRERKSKGLGKLGRSKWKGIRQIEFAYDKERHATIAGPVVGKSAGHTTHILEFGGPIKKPLKRGKRKAFIAPRPYARPSLKAVAKNLPSIMKTQVIG